MNIIIANHRKKLLENDLLAEIVHLGFFCGQ